MPAMPTVTVVKTIGADEHLDELHEAVAERLHGDAPIGPQPSDEDAERDRDEHLHVEARPAALLLHVEQPTSCAPGGGRP